MSFPVEKVKLVVWDLDDCFWKGILSEGEITIPEENIAFVHDLSDAGIINSVCSKNDREKALERLKKAGIEDLFVFLSIDWTGKGQRLKAQIEAMALRPANVLFVDDNPSNLEEAKFYAPELMTALPQDLDELRAYAKANSSKDPTHTRLNEYRVLETKSQARTSFSSNEEFLLASNIKVFISSKVLPKERRLFDLVNRTNQLNYTKKRPSETDFVSSLAEKDAQSFYVEAEDKFGYYGIVGFAQVKNNELIHFLFSCRTMGMGIEQYLYVALGRPKLKVAEPVSMKLDVTGPAPAWIHRSKTPLAQETIDKKPSRFRYLFKGPCDIQMVFNYLHCSGEIVTEFTHNASNGASIESPNHTSQIVEAYSIDPETKKKIESLPFADPSFFSKEIYQPYNAVFLSTLTDSNLGVYQEKDSQVKIAFGEFTNDLTLKENEEKYLAGEIYNAGVPFTKENLKEFREHYSFVGRLTPEQSFENLKAIRTNMNPSTLLVLFLGSEKPFEGRILSPAYEKREEWFKGLNSLLVPWSKQEKNIILIAFDDFITSPKDYLDTINHFQPEIYYQTAKACSQIINNLEGEQNSGVKSKAFLGFSKLKKKIKKLIGKN